MYRFTDYYHNKVTLSFDDHPFSRNPKHVWVICTYKNKWLLTRHKERGLEFPGGKVEENESAREAAIREVKEETGGSIEKIRYLGQYTVAGKGGTIIKNVYFAEIKDLAVQKTYYETEGPIELSHIPKNVKRNKQYSFIMKDDVLKHCMAYIRKKR
ncbi:RNA deprotection pyrophosphohydrolase [Lentibacillus sp. CBA3610]|uniref:RNA deprotection pyrophosphohydrolase n=1 Tax=Lentibacillus sp. CBA3610 TaxID=2518176 RepID=UPI0015958017|nr:nucleoside triphosphatase YtkD [Lentibacillus sp. CBA3610]QKY69756.1 nucleoside triphosphatase YtkD [Lentibacillus sp. CBA3610]